MSSSSLKFSNSTQHGHLFTSLRHCTEQSRTLRNTLAQASQACSGPAEEAILKGRLSPVGSVGSFCFCSLQEVQIFTSHPHKTRWLPRKLPLHLALSNKEFHFSQAEVRQLSAMPASQRHSKSRRCLSRSLSVCLLGWDSGRRCFATSAGRPCECLPCSPVVQLECV